jgi:DNA polymerase III subunit epsilon
MSMEKLPILAFLDVETTGLSPDNGDRVCEIAIMRCQGKKTTRWQSLINPCRAMSPGAAAVNGITDDMVKDAPKFSEVAEKVLKMLDNAILVCHNVSFDSGFLRAECNRCGMKLPYLPAIDTLRVARRFFRFPSNSLGNIAASLSIAVEGQHRAMADVSTMHQIFNHFWTELKAQGVVTDMEEMCRLHIDDLRQRGAIPSLPPFLEEAIRSRKSVNLYYLSRFGRQTKRIVRPLKIVHPFLEAYCTLRREKRTFRIDRIMKVEPVQ